MPTPKPTSGIVKDLQGLLSDDGSALDRMNAGQGGDIYPQWFRDVADHLKQQGLTDETVVAWAEQNPEKIRALEQRAKFSS